RWRSDRRRAARELATTMNAWHPTAEEVAAARERSAIVWKAIDALPDRLRIVVVLASIEGHDTREGAQLLEIPEGRVRSRLFTARRTLAEQLRWLAIDSPTD